jgi:hypothetical protein
MNKGIKKFLLNSLPITFVLVLAVGWFIMNITYNNQEKGVRNRGEAQKQKIEVVFDEMWKILQDQAGVTTEYKDSFKEIYIPLIEGRYSQGDGSLMKWITEHNPQFDTSLYQSLMLSIEKYRALFAKEQETMIDIKRQHKDLCTFAPSSWFIDNKEEIEYTVISSTRTKQVMESGIDDSAPLFQNK